MYAMGEGGRYRSMVVTMKMMVMSINDDADNNLVTLSVASHTIGLGKEEPSMREEWMEKVNTAPNLF